MDLFSAHKALSDYKDASLRYIGGKVLVDCGDNKFQCIPGTYLSTASYSGSRKTVSVDDVRAAVAADYKSERLKRGLSQAALAALVGVSRGCVNYREAGHPRYPITSEAWLAICSLPQATNRRLRNDDE